MASNAVGSERVSRIVGYKISTGDFSTTSPNLPQRILVIGEANTANQSGLDTSTWNFTTLQKAGERYGYGSPIYLALRLIKSQNFGVGGIPVDVIPQAAAVGATSKKITIACTGTATGNGTHTVVICGRRQIDSYSYDININTGDTLPVIVGKISDAINAALTSPVSATHDTYSCIAESKWKGLTANDVNIYIDTNDNSLGITYSVSSTQSGAGTPSIVSALNQIGATWYTQLVNTYGTVSSVMSSLESFNGIADPDTPTGRYAALIMKPFVAITGSVADDPSSITNAKKNEMTIAIAPAPYSKGLPLEAAANMTILSARVAQDTPHLDVQGKSYPDMPVPISGTTFSMQDYNERDRIVQLGCSTVDLVAGKYQVQDFVTTYHKDGELPPQFRYVRNIFVDLNVYYGYYLKEQTYVVDHTIANDDDIVNAVRVVKPKTWKSELGFYADDLVSRGLIVDAQFMKDSTVVNISGTNPDRLETFFRYKRSGCVRIASTTAQAGFNFGTV